MSATLSMTGPADAQSSQALAEFPPDVASTESTGTTPSHREHAQQTNAVTIRAIAEFGGLLPLYHHIQLGRGGTNFNYIREGGQDVIFPVARLSVEVRSGRHYVTFLYQPLELNSEVVLTRPLTVDGLTFPEETPLDLRYGFPFYRLSYAWDVAPSRALRAALGGSFQLRDATITFTSADGTARRARRDVGPVPALKAHLRYDFASGWFGALEVDGFYAPVKYFNGGDSDVTGAIIDASARAGYRMSPRLDAFVNVRWIGGGAEGSSEAEDFSDGYNRNWLHFLTVTLGVDFALI